MAVTKIWPVRDRFDKVSTMRQTQKRQTRISKSFTRSTM